MKQASKNKLSKTGGKPASKQIAKATEKSKPDLNKFIVPASLTIILLITWFIFKDSINFQFTNWDDDVYVLENKNVQTFSTESTAWFFTHPSASNYHPLTMLSLAIDYHFALEKDPVSPVKTVLNPSVFHRTNLILHLLNVILVFLFIFLITERKLWISIIVAFLFAIHPMHVESVAWIAERKDVLYSFFFLSGLISYLKYLEKGKIPWFIICSLFFILSLLSKPSAVIFPLILFAVDYYRKRAFSLKMIIEKVFLLIPAIIFGLITVMIQSKDAIADFRTFSIFQRMLFFSYGSVMYLFKLLVPIGLSAFYPYPLLNAAGFLPLIFYLAPVILLILATAVIYSSRFTRVPVFGIAFFFIAIVLVLQFVSVGAALMADRYTYIPSIGLFFIIAYYSDKIIGSKSGFLSRLRIPAILVLTAYLIFTVSLSYERVRIWQNPETLWTDVIKTYPWVETAYKNRGNYYASLNQTDKALSDNLILVSLHSKDPTVYSNLGNIYGLQGETEKSLEAYSRSISLDSMNYEIYLNRGVTYSRAKQFAKAMDDFQKALVLKPGAIEVYRNRSYARLEMGDFEQSIADYNILISQDSPSDVNYLNRGLCFYRLNKTDEALSDFRKCVSLNPGNGNGLFNIAVILDSRKNYRGALEYLEKARETGFPVNPAFEEKLRKQF